MSVRRELTVVGLMMIMTMMMRMNNDDDNLFVDKLRQEALITNRAMSRTRSIIIITLILPHEYEPDMHNEIFQSPGKGQQRYSQSPLIPTLN